MVEIRNYGQGSNETIVTYPHSDVRFVNDQPSYIHRDLRDSVRMITNGAGERAHRAIYKSFGEAQSWTYDLTEAVENKGWIGERFDAGAGLQYLNARYYDPHVGLFTQPDWFDVTVSGVGTNRYAYSFNDPVNLMDPGGNFAVTDGSGNVIGRGSDDLTPIGAGETAEDAWGAAQRGERNTVSFGDTFGDVEVTFSGDVTLSAGFLFGQNVVSQNTTGILEFPTTNKPVAGRLLGRVLGPVALGMAVYDVLTSELSIQFHYTTPSGLAGIKACNCLLAAQPNRRSHPSGVYFT